MAEPALQGLLEKEAIRTLIQKTAAFLDNEELGEWIGLFAENSEYELVTYGPEIRSPMTWWKSTRDKLKDVLEEVPEHVRDTGQRRHLVTPVSVSVSGGSASAESHFVVIRTDPDGTSAVYASGRYEDELINEDGRWLYTVHRCVLDTRMLGTGTHVPL
jgi:3-phenylpropionate/cinnamic acid dioxygenase small subunit